MQVNYEYAQTYLRPEKQIAIALSNIGFDITV